MQLVRSLDTITLAAIRPIELNTINIGKFLVLLSECTLLFLLEICNNNQQHITVLKTYLIVYFESEIRRTKPNIP